MNDITRILSAIEGATRRPLSGSCRWSTTSWRRLAAQRLAQERPGQTLQATALVHEAYLRLVGGGQPESWSGRAHFFAAAAEAMRRILVEAARRKGRLRHGGGRKRVQLEDGCTLAGPPLRRRPARPR